MAARTLPLGLLPRRAAHAQVELPIEALAAMIPPRGSGAVNIRAAAVTHNVVVVPAGISSRLKASFWTRELLLRRRTTQDAVGRSCRSGVGVELELVVTASTEPYATLAIVPVAIVATPGAAPKE